MNPYPFDKDFLFLYSSYMRYLSFILLLSAFIISTAYQYYRSTINEVPEYDAFGKSEIIRFSILIGISFIALIHQKWSQWLTIFYCLFCVGIVLIKYYPNVYVLRENKMIDIFEPIVYMVLILFAALTAIPKRKFKNKYS